MPESLAEQQLTLSRLILLRMIAHSLPPGTARLHLLWGKAFPAAARMRSP